MPAPLIHASLPLFPLHTVFYPGGFLPLRVFEMRYRSMVRSCREEGKPFGVVTLLSGDEVQRPAQALEHFHPIGTLAAIDGVQSLSSGVELIQCLGQTRFRVMDARRLPRGLWVADVELLPDDQPVTVPEDLQQAALALRQVLHKVPQRHLENATAAQFTDCGWVANRWCELLPMSQATQLSLLAIESPLLRLELVSDALEGAGIVP
jgi:Lon protease-like protein